MNEGLVAVATVCTACSFFLAAFTVLEMARTGLAPGRLLLGWLEPFVRTIYEGHVPNLRERVGLSCLLGAIAVVAGWSVGGPVAAGLLTAAVPVAVASLIGRATVRYRLAVDRGLPEVARALADSLTAGQSPRAALENVARELEGGVGFELELVSRDLRMGLPTAEVLSRLARRIRSARVDAFSGAITSLTLSGGDLAGLLRRFADGAVERDRMADEARTATAQARFTGFLVAALPVGAGLFIELTGMDLFASVGSSGVALALLISSLGLQAIGFMVISRVARVGSG